MAMEYALFVFFTCGWGCGTPTQFIAQQRYPTYEKCDAAGRAWLSPNANPTQTVASYRCVSSGDFVASEQNGHGREHKEHKRRVFD
jgi:hypothetical protein